MPGVCKAAGKTAIRRAIDAERKKYEKREAKKKECQESGVEYMSDEEKEEEIIPYITKDMLKSALSGARRSVSKQDHELSG